MPAPSRARARDDIIRLVHRAAGADRFAQDVSRVVKRAVPFDGAFLMTTDPATLLPTGLVMRNSAELGVLPRLIEMELCEPDYNNFTIMARQGRPAASLSDATRGDLEQSPRHRELCEPNGFDDELRVVCTDASGTWGALTLARAAGRPRFEHREVRFLASLAPLLADGFRRAAVFGNATTVDDRATGVVVLAPDNSVEMATAGAESWLAALAASDDRGGELPVAVLAVAARARRIAGDHQNEFDRQESWPDPFARLRVRAAEGRWMTVRASVLGDGPHASVAVLMEQAHPPELAPLIADAYGLTENERRVIELVARGLTTSDVGARLHLSAYTVQDHLKSIFNKTGTGSRGELISRLFFDHYAPRLGITDPR